MTAPLVVAFDAAAADQRPNKRAKKLDTAWRCATRAVHDWLRQSGAITRDDGFGFGVPDQLHGLEQLRADEHKAHYRLVLFWGDRTKRLEAILRRALACDGVDEDARRAIVDGLHGTGTGRRRNRQSLSESEWRLVEDYRRMADPDRVMLRTLLLRLASCGAAGNSPRENIGKPVITIAGDDREGA